jgi:hypothetical protein
MTDADLFPCFFVEARVVDSSENDPGAEIPSLV